MTFLRDLPSVWPFGTTDESSYTDIIPILMESKHSIWRIKIEAPDPYMTYTGICLELEKDTDQVAEFSLVVGGTKRNVFSSLSAKPIKNLQWTPLPYPITNRICAIHEDSIDILIKHTKAVRGVLLLVAHKFDDMDIAVNRNYAFYDEKTEGIRSLMTEEGHFYKVNLAEEPIWQKPVKVLPPLDLVLRGGWSDISPCKNTLDLQHPFMKNQV